MRIQYEIRCENPYFTVCFRYVSKEEYSNSCMNDRNKYMVEQSDVVIAVWNGKPSGTGNTVKMTKLSGKKIRVVNPYNLAKSSPYQNKKAKIMLN